MPTYPFQPRVWASDLSWDTDTISMRLLPYDDLDLVLSVLLDAIYELPETDD